MLTELIAKPETDVVSALEDRVRSGGKIHDLRLEKTVLALAKHDYPFGDWHTSLVFLDEMWVLANLSWKIGRQDIYLQTVGMLKDYNPYCSRNPLVKGLAHYDAVERSTSLQGMERVLSSARSYLGKDLLGERMSRIVNEAGEKKKAYLYRQDQYRKKITGEIEMLAGKADDLARKWEVSQAAALYERAEELAEYRLNDKEMAEGLKQRFRRVSEELAAAKKP